MDYGDTLAFEKIEKMNARINIIQGGARAGKTISVLMGIVDLSFEVNDSIIHIMSDSYPNLANGAMMDWQRLLRGTNRDYYFNVNQSSHVWTNKCTGTIIKFIACDAEDALGAPRDYLFVNEANRINYDTFGQLEVRTTEKIWLDFNPVNEFWAHTEVMGKRDDWEFLKLTYKDNDRIPENVKKALLQRKGNNNWWRVYGLGEIGSLEGNVYEGWTPVDGKPDGFVLRVVGVDFGFSKDPTAVVAVYENEMNDREIFIQTRLYANKMLTPDLIATLKEDEEIKDELFVCDNSRPEIIAEMCANGLRAIGCNKTAGEKMNGKMYNIDLVQRRKVLYDANDKDLEKEYLTYAWRKKKSTGEQLAEPEDGNDHAMDALAYAVRELSKNVDDLDDLSVEGEYDYTQPTDEEDDGWGDDF